MELDRLIINLKNDKKALFDLFLDALTKVHHDLIDEKMEKLDKCANNLIQFNEDSD